MTAFRVCQLALVFSVPIDWATRWIAAQGSDHRNDSDMVMVPVNNPKTLLP